MLLLASREILAAHMSRLLEIRLGQALTVRVAPPSRVGVTWELTALGKATPDFQVGFGEDVEIDKSAVRDCIKDVWGFYKAEIGARFSGLTQRRVFEA